MKMALAFSTLILLLGWHGLAWGQDGNLTSWTGPGIGKIDPTGGRAGGPALSVATTVANPNQPWVSPACPVQGQYLRASAWMKVRDLYYQDFGFFAYGAVEFLDAAGKPLGEQIFINSRDLMLAEPLLFERMTLNDKRLSFDWRYAEKTLAVPATAASVRLKFGFPSRVVGEAWLDDPQLSFSDTPQPAENQEVAADRIPTIEIRLRTPQHRLDADPLGAIFFPGEDAVFCVAVPAAVKNAQKPVLLAQVLDSENFTVWQQEIPLTGAGDWVTVTVPGSLTTSCFNRYLDAKCEVRDGEQLLARNDLSFGFLDDYKLDQIREGPEERFINGVFFGGQVSASYWELHQARFNQGVHSPMIFLWQHVVNLWKDAAQPLQLEAALQSHPYYKLADQLHADNYGVIFCVAVHGPPDPIPAFSNLGQFALVKPEALRTFTLAAAKRFPYVKYWRLGCEQYALGVPGYPEAYVNDQKVFYETIKSVIPDACVILDNQGLWAGDAATLRKAGLFDYCDAIDPHLYGTVEGVEFGRFRQEKELLESWGIHKRWISLESAPFAGTGSRGIITPDLAEEIPKNLTSFFALGGEKVRLFAAVAENPADPFYNGALGGVGWGPTMNYFSLVRLTEKLGTTPTVGTFELGEGPRVRYNRFADDQHTVLLAWSRDGDNTLKIATHSPITVTDNVRTAARLQPSSEGACYVTVGFQPVYIEGTNDMALSLAGQTEMAPASGGGLLAGAATTVKVSVPDNAADTASVLLPPGMTAAANQVPVRDAKASFSIIAPGDHNGQYATLTFLYGTAQGNTGLIVHRYELIRPVRAEIRPDGAVRDNRPRYVVRIINDNPVATRGRVVAASPVTDASRPEEMEQTFAVPAHKFADLTFEFSPVDLTTIRAQEREYPAVARVYPADSAPFTIRDLVSFTPLPKVKPGLRIDGDLSDWAGQPSFPLGKPEQYVALQPGAQPGDIHGDLMVAWDRATIYFAVQVRGKDAASSGGIKLFLSNAEDQRTPDLEDKGDYREYDFLRGPQGVKLVARSRTKGGYGVWYVTREVPGGTDYEISIPVWETATTVQLMPDSWIRLSAALLDAKGKGYWQWYGGAAEPKNWGAYGDFQLATYGQDEWGLKYGEPYGAGGGRERSGFVGLALLPDGGRVLVSSTAKSDMGEALVENAQGQILRRFPIKTGRRVHTVMVDAAGRLVVGDRVLGVRFFSLEDGHQILVGPLQDLYPLRVHVEYRSQGVAQNQAGNYFVTVERKRRTAYAESNRMTLTAGVTMFTPAGEEVKALGQDVPFTTWATVHVWGQMGEATGDFLYPESIAIDTANRMWVADVDAKTLQIFGRTGPEAYSYSRLPLLYAPMPEGLFPCHMQALTDGQMLLWNADRMALASFQDGKLQVGPVSPLSGKVEDLKVQGSTAVTVAQDGTVVAYHLFHHRHGIRHERHT